MAGSPKSKKGKRGSEKDKDSPKSKGKKGKDDEIAKIEELKSVIIEDELWQSVIAIVVIDSQKLHDNLLQQLNNLPANFTVITPKNILNTSEKESPGVRSRGSSKTRKRSASKESKKTAKTKAAGAKKNSKQEEQKDEKQGDGQNSATTCILLKKYILELKTADLTEHGKGEQKEHHEAINNDMMNDMTSYLKLKSNTENVPGNIAKRLTQRYIILWGFYDPNLFQECLNFNVLVKAIINIKDKCPLKIPTEITPVAEKKQKGKAKKSFDRRASEEYSIFVDKLDENMKDEKFLETNKDVLFLNYLIKLADEEVEKTNNSFELNFLKILCRISEAWGKFTNYNKSLKIQEVPDIQETLTLDDAYLYTTMVSMVPPECTTLPIIIHSIKEQICWWDEHILSNMGETCEDTELSATSTIDTKASMHSKSIDQSFITPSRPTIDTETSLKSEVSIPNITPALIDERDEIRRKTFHLHIPEINFQKITTDMLLSSPIYKLWLDYPFASISKSKWYEFHLQRFKKCAENCFFDSDKLFTLYLHQSIMNVLISKPDKLSVVKDEYIEEEEEESDTYLRPTIQETADSVTSFIRGMICNILCRGSKNYTNYTSSAESSVFSTETSGKEVTDNTNSLLSASSKWYETKKPGSSKFRGLLDEKQNYRQIKINKLKSFLLCSEFVNLYEDINQYGGYEDTDHMKQYEFIENLNLTSLCQCLQEAYTNFANVNYYYFPPTDTIFLWFNNSVEKDLMSSRKMRGILETPLGFRDFYQYKLGGKKNLEEMAVTESVADVSGLSDNFSEGSSTDQVSHSSHDSHSTVDEFLQTTVTNLGTSRIEHNEFYDYFLSADSTKVTVKKTKYFSDQMDVSVSVNKNNTSLHYNFLPEVSNASIEVMMKMYNDITVHTRLAWSQPVTTEIQDELEINDSKLTDYSLSSSCDLKLTVPSGLLVEVVPIESSIGPFYIRQRYLLKGPTCGKIWEETHRCYLKNGIILIFNSDNTVYILYNNGTMVRCNDFEWEKIVLENVPAEDESAEKENDLEENKTKIENEGISDKGKKEGKGKGKSKDKKDDKKQESIPISKKKKGKKMSKPIGVEENLNVEKDKSDHEVYMYKITQYFVLSWDGSCTEFIRNISKNDFKIHNLRIAFDKINQELYLKRSDGMTSLFTPKELSVLFPDGSKITSYTDDCKELNVESDTLMVAEDTTQELGSINEMDIHCKATDSELITVSSEESSVTVNSESQNTKDQSFNEDNFVYVETSYLFEHCNYASIKYINEDSSAEIMLPGNIKVYLDKNGMFTIDSDGNEKITLTDTDLLFEAQVLEGSSQRSFTTLHFKNVKTNPTVSCQTVDSFCNVFLVNEKGHTSLVRNGTDYSCSFNNPLHPKNVERYFVFNRDLSGYEIIRNHKIDDESNAEIIKTPIIKNNDELFTLYTETPILKNKSEQFLMSYSKENNLPSLLKRKDLLKLEEMPDNIWFYPEFSKITANQSEENLQKCGESFQKRSEIPTAMRIFKYSKIKNNINLSNWFLSAINEYMTMSESIVKRYLCHYPDEVRNEMIYAEGVFHRQQVLGSRSYYLTDNLPAVVLGHLLDDQDRISIHSVSASTNSKITSLFDMMKQIKQK